MPRPTIPESDAIFRPSEPPITTAHVSEGQSGKGDGDMTTLEQRVGNRETDVKALVKDVAEIKGRLATMPTTFQMVSWSVGITLTVGALIVGVLMPQISRLDAKIDSLAAKLSDEFHAQRLETATQTAAIANSITATKQQAPQIIVMPASALTAPVAPEAPAK